MGPGIWGSLIIFVIVLAIFGPKNLPLLGQMAGSLLREVKGVKDNLPSKEDLLSPSSPEKSEKKPEDKNKA